MRFLRPPALLLLPALCPSCCSMPDFAKVASPATFPADVPRPVFVMDAGDAAENPVVAVFLDRGADRTEITVVFEDETPPWLGVQTLFLSEPYRFVRYRRKADVESFEYLAADGEQPARLSFPGSWAADQGFRALWPCHPSAALDLDEFERPDGRPRVYVTTWNHLFHHDPQGLAERETVDVADYSVYAGSRADVEALFCAED